MAVAIISGIYAAAVLLASYFYLRSRYKNKEDNSPFVPSIKLIILTVLVYLSITVLQSVYATFADFDRLLVLLKWLSLVWGLYLLAYIDYKERKIPNNIVLVLLGIRTLLLIYEVATNLEHIKIVLVYPILGAAIGGIILAVAMLISRKGVGMGDIKMFIAIGAFVGSSEIIATLFYTFFISAVGGIILLITKKAKIKDSIPMAPFAFAGVLTEYLLLMVGG